MRTKLLGAFCLLFPLLSVAADIQRITPITSDNSVKIEVTLSAEAGEHLLLDATIVGSQNKEKLCNFSKEYLFNHKTDTTVILLHIN